MVFPVWLEFFGTGSLSCNNRCQSCIGMTTQRWNGKNQYWLFDCGDGALHQLSILSKQFNKQRISRIFITHLHLDHCSGLPNVICSLVNSNTKPADYRLDIYGPAHLTSLLKPILFYSCTALCYPVCIHEFLLPNTVLDDTSAMEVENLTTVAVYPDPDGYWTCCCDEQGTVRSGCLKHRVPCWGYCYQQRIPLMEFDENGHQYVKDTQDGKKIVIFGDTYDSSAMIPLVEDCDLLVHEMSYGPLITDLDRKYLHSDLRHWEQIQSAELEKEKNRKRWNDIVERTRQWGHSDAQMVGTFASSIRAKRLVLTHFSSRYECSPRSQKSMSFLIREQVKLWFKGYIDVAFEGFSCTVSPVC